MRSGSRLSAAEAAPGILLPRHGLKVIWVTAGAIAAEVVEIEPGRYLTLRRLVGRSVDGDILPPKAHLSVALWAN
jgi:hypothetical protein